MATQVKDTSAKQSKHTTGAHSGEIVSRRDPEIRATPAQGCDVCAALAKQWDETNDRDVLIEINNHPHSEPKLSRVKAWKAQGASVG
ncbi:hypothetical protein ABZ235_09785 [Streptomyces canus]|uniref:hypothetical protein n=1 Tax=Streptomyces canus TaxID=58343 RepID=UPI0033BD96A0